MLVENFIIHDISVDVTKNVRKLVAPHGNGNLDTNQNYTRATNYSYPSRVIINLSSSFPMRTLRRERIWPKEDKSAMVSTSDDCLMV